MPVEHLLDDAALNARSTAVNQTDLAAATGVGGPDVLVHDRTDVPGSEGVEVETVLDRDLDRGGGRGWLCPILNVWIAVPAGPGISSWRGPRV